MDKCCGNCAWFLDHMSDYGTCQAPIPDCVTDKDAVMVYKTEGPDCPCHKEGK